jgi:hypothetical protein
VVVRRKALSQKDQMSYWVCRGSNTGRDPQQAALWRRLKKIESLPKKDQKALLHYLDALVKSNGRARTAG